MSRSSHGRTTALSSTARSTARSNRGSDGIDELPPSRRRVRRARVWMVLLLLTPVCLAGISLLAFATGGPPEPVIEPRATPPGYYAVTDADFGYAIPDSYRQNTTWTDQNADFLYGDSRAFVAETLLITKVAPAPASHPPASFRSFGQATVVPYSLRDGHTIRIPGTDYAFEETMTRPGGYRATVIDTWRRDSSTQMWLLIRSPAVVTRAVIASLQG